MIENRLQMGLFSIIAVMIIWHLFYQRAFGSELDSAQTSQRPCNNCEVKIVESSEFDYESHAYYSSLLRLALSKTDDPLKPTSIVESSGHLVQERVLRQLNQEGEIDVFWTVTSKLREQQAIPVRVPLLNGVMGYHALLIHSSALGDFRNIRNAQDLKRLVAGQGHDWPDIKILEHNGFTALGTSNYDAIIELLRAGRIDYFPRALHEAVIEAESLNDPDIIIAPSVLLHYPSYVFFFVSKSKPELALRIERGLNIARQDGSFAALFEKYINFSDVKKALKLSERTVFKLDNPHLSKATLDAAPADSLSTLLQ
tara:strand:- start:254 stop:1192 length:939 start_codon:yes stop_codon:yes gene_type:complete